MRILFLTNFYKVNSGGEEQSCRQVVEDLQNRGHVALILTSMHGTNNQLVEKDGIYQSLYLEMDLAPWRNSVTFFTQRKFREQHNLRVFERVLKQFDPDIIFIWGMWNLHSSLAALAETLYPNQVIYRFASYWPTLPSQQEMYWRKTGRKWYSRLLKAPLSYVALTMLAKEQKRSPLNFKHAVCVSAATRDHLVKAGIPVSQARIIYTGLDASKYRSRGQNEQADRKEDLRLLYAGRLSSDKGIDTLIDGMAKLIHVQGRRNIKLSLAGSGSSEYEGHLRQRIGETGLSDYMSLLGWVIPDKIPGLLREHQVLLLPSVWPEPFSRVVLEGMVSGLVVVAARTGGTPEVITDGENGLLFNPNDPDDLAAKISQLMDNPGSFERIVSAAQQTILQRFTMSRMMDEIEDYLLEVASASSPQAMSQPEPLRNLN